MISNAFFEDLVEQYDLICRSLKDEVLRIKPAGGEPFEQTLGERMEFYKDEIQEQSDGLDKVMEEWTRATKELETLLIAKEHGMDTSYVSEMRLLQNEYEKKRAIELDTLKADCKKIIEEVQSFEKINDKTRKKQLSNLKDFFTQQAQELDEEETRDSKKASEQLRREQRLLL